MALRATPLFVLHAFWLLVLGLPSRGAQENPASGLDPSSLAQTPAPRFALRFVSDDERIDKLLVGRETQDAIGAGLAFLAARQGDDGAWRGDGEEALPDLSTTALALLALLGDGHSARDGVHAEVVSRGVTWILAAQDTETGQIGSTVFEHLVATQVLAESLCFAPEDALAPQLAQAVSYLLVIEKWGAWDLQPRGEGEPTMTAWAVLALLAAQDAGVTIEAARFEKTLKWMAKSTRSSGAVPRRRGSSADVNRGVAAMLFTRLLLGERADRVEVVGKQSERLQKRSALPEWPSFDADAAGTRVRVDLQYWHWAAYAMRSMDDRGWGIWQTSLAEVLGAHQSDDGGWPDVGLEAECTGRVYATAFALLALEAGYRFTPHAAPATTAGALLGIGGGARAGGIMGGRFGARRNLRAAGGSGTESALSSGLDWLVAHQDDDGRWDTDGFMKHDSERDPSTGPGDAHNDVGVTGLALLALLGDGHTTQVGEHKDAVLKGVQWLIEQQNPQTGRVGDSPSHTFIYSHAIATLALAEVYHLSRSAILAAKAQAAVEWLERARNPDSGWRYDFPPKGKSDTSVTAWAVLALRAADDAGLKVDPAVYTGALAWIDSMTDKTTGRVGYESIGSPSARIARINDHYPTEKSESMTAASLFVKHALGATDDGDPELMEKGADLLVEALPEWDPEAFDCDMYYWYYGTYATFQIGGKHWNAWNKAFKTAALSGQRKDGSHAGSWDPVGPWGHAGGRVYSTAVMALCLEVYYRYPRMQ